MKVSTGMKVITEAVNTLDMIETSSGGHTIIITNIDLDPEVDKPQNIIFVQYTL